MRRRVALGLVVLACGRTSLDAGVGANGGGDAAQSGGTSGQGGISAQSAGTSSARGGDGSGGVATAGVPSVAGRASLPGGGASGSGGAPNDAGAAQGGALEIPSDPVLDFHELSGKCRVRVLDVARAANGDIALAGNYCSDLRLDAGPTLLDGSDSFDGFVLVLDGQRRPRWARQFQGEFGESVNCVTFLPGGHVFAQGSAQDRRVFAAEMTTEGELVWSTTALSTIEYRPGQVLYNQKRGVVEEVGGLRETLASSPFYDRWDIYLWRVNERGEHVAGGYYRLDGWDQARASHAALGAANELVLGGWGRIGEREPAFVRKLSDTRVELFTTPIQTTDSAELVGVAVDAAGAIVTGGAFHGTLTLGSSTFETAQDESSQEWLAKLDGSGKPLWVKSEHEGSFSKLSSVALDEADDIVVSGVNEHGLFVRSLSPDGERIWSRDFAASQVTAVRALADGPDRLLLVGEASGAQFGPSWQSHEGSVFLVELAR